MSTRKVRSLPARKTRAISREVITNPNKGLNNLGSASLIDNREWADLLNIEFDEGGVARKRMGYDTYGNTLTGAKGIGILKTTSDTYKCVIDGTAFKSTTTGTWTTNSSITFTTGQEVAFTQVKGKMFIWNGTDGGSYFDGTTLARPGTIPKGKFSIYYNSFHIASGVSGKDSRVYIALLADPTDFTNAATTLMDSTEVPGATVFAGTGANYIDVQPDDGDYITGLGVFQDVVIIFKQFATYQLTLDATGTPTVAPITKAAGCIAPRSIVSVENDLYFLSREGIRVLGNEPNFFSAIRTNILSKRIDPIILGMSTAQMKNCVATFFNNQYIITIPDAGGTFNLVLSYNKQFQAWSKWNAIDATSLVSAVENDNSRILYFIKSAGTQLYQFTPGTYNDDGVGIEAYLLSKVFDFKAPDITKYFVDLGLIFRTISGEVTLAVYTQGNTLLGGATGLSANPVTDGMGYSMLGEIMLGLGGGDADSLTAYTDIVKRVVINTNSTNIRFKISNDRVDENFVLLGFINAFYPFGHYLFDSTNKVYL